MSTETLALPVQNNRLGALLLTGSAAVFTAEVILVRMVNGEASNEQIIFSRGLVQLIVVSIILSVRYRKDVFRSVRTNSKFLHLCRGLTSLVCWWLYYKSFQVLDLALATTVTFTSALFVVAFVAPLLGEKVTKIRWAATILGFLGVAYASGNSGFHFDPSILYGLGAAAGGSVLVYLNRLLSRSESTTTIMFYIGLITTLGTLPGAVGNWHSLNVETWLVVMSSASLGTLGMMLTIEAYRVGEVSALAPFPYIRLVFAIVAGFLFFSEIPQINTLIGSGLIVFCALIANWKQKKIFRTIGA